MTNKEKFIEVFGEEPQRQYTTKSWWKKQYVSPSEDMIVIDNRLKVLSERVENIEKQIKKQIKEDNEEQLNKLKAELAYAKFSCALPIITDMMHMH